MREQSHNEPIPAQPVSEPVAVRRRCFSARDWLAFGIAMAVAGGVYLVTLAPRPTASPEARGPCARVAGVEDFARLRSKLDSCLTGALMAKDRAAQSLTKVMIPAALDYPA